MHDSYYLDRKIFFCYSGNTVIQFVQNSEIFSKQCRFSYQPAYQNFILFQQSYSSEYFLPIIIAIIILLFSSSSYFLTINYKRFVNFGSSIFSFFFVTIVYYKIILNNSPLSQCYLLIFILYSIDVILKKCWFLVGISVQVS